MGHIIHEYEDIQKIITISLQIRNVIWFNASRFHDNLNTRFAMDQDFVPNSYHTSLLSIAHIITTLHADYILQWHFFQFTARFTWNIK